MIRNRVTTARWDRDWPAHIQAMNEEGWTLLGPVSTPPYVDGYVCIVFTWVKNDPMYPFGPKPVEESPQ